MGAPRTYETQPTDDSAESALRSIGSHLCFWVIACLIVWLDLWSKHWAFSSLVANEIRPIFPAVMDFRRSLNAGAVFGSFAGHTSAFIFASLLALGFVFYLFAHSQRRQRSLHIALALILAGALGNLYDRAFVVADVVTHNSEHSRREARIGKIISQPDDLVVRIGDWPDGTHVQSFPKGAVSIRQQGVVRDFIKFVPEFPPWVPRLAGKDIWPWVFNVADASLVCGVALLLLHTIFDRGPRKRRA